MTKDRLYNISCWNPLVAECSKCGVFMYEWLKRRVDDVVQGVQAVRINAAYPAYEKEQRELHIASAMRRFSVADVEAELTRVMRPVLAEAHQRYVIPSAALESQLATAMREVLKPKYQLALFERNYKAELDPLYSQLQELKEQRTDLQSKKTAAHRRLQNAKDDIESWHYKSSHGNGFKRQSVKDLEDYKHDRESAVHDLQHSGREIDRIKVSIEKTKQKVEEVKDARQQMFDLRDQGLYSAKIQRTLAAAEARVSEVLDSITDLHNAQIQFMEQSRYQCGAIELQTQIEKIKTMLEKHISSFDGPIAKEARRDTHRELWLKQHSAKST